VCLFSKGGIFKTYAILRILINEVVFIEKFYKLKLSGYCLVSTYIIEKSALHHYDFEVVFQLY
jgi:hypothetical protein